MLVITILSWLCRTVYSSWPILISNCLLLNVSLAFLYYFSYSYFWILYICSYILFIFLYSFSIWDCFSAKLFSSSFIVTFFSIIYNLYDCLFLHELSTKLPSYFLLLHGVGYRLFIYILCYFCGVVLPLGF